MVSVVEASSTLGALSKGQNRVVFRNPRGLKRYYCIRNASGVLAIEWSTDGTNWGNNPTPISSTFAALVYDVKIFDNGTQLKIFVAVLDNTNNWVIYYLLTVADTDSIPSVAGSNTVVSGLTKSLTGPNSTSITRTYNGRLVVAYTTDFVTMGKTYRRTYVIGSNNDGTSPTWSGSTLWDDPSTNTNNASKDAVWFGLCSFSSTFPDSSLVYANLPDSRNATGYYVVTAIPEWNGTAFASLTEASWTTNSGGVFWLVSGVIDSLDFCHIAYEIGNGTGPVNSRKSGTDGNDDFGSEINIFGSGSAALDASTLSINLTKATNDLYFFYHVTADTTNFHYRITPVDTISWGTEQTITYSNKVDALSSSEKDFVSSIHIAGHDTSSNVWYHELSLGAAPVNVSGSGNIAEASTLLRSANISKPQTISETKSLISSANISKIQTISESFVLIRSANISKIETVGETKTSLISSAKPSKTQTLSETQTLKLSQAPTGSEHIAQTKIVIVSAKPSGSGHIGQTKTLVLGGIPVSGSGHIGEAQSLLRSAAPRGSASIAQIQSLLRSAAPKGFESIAQTKAVIISAKPSGAEHIAQIKSLIVSINPTASGHIGEAKVLIISENPTGSGHIAQTFNLNVGGSVSVSGSGHFAQTQSLIRSIAPVASARITQTKLSVVSENPHVTGGTGQTSSLRISANPSKAQHLAQTFGLTLSQSIRMTQTISQTFNLNVPGAGGMNLVNWIGNWMR